MLWRIIALSFVLFRPPLGSHSLYYALMLFLLYLKDDKSSPGGNRGAEKLRQWDSFCGTDKFVVYKTASANFWYPRNILFIHAVLGSDVLGKGLHIFLFKLNFINHICLLM